MIKASTCRHVCPYHASRDILNEGAALVFVTYSQLLDPPVRSANGLDDLLKGAVLVFDEVQPSIDALTALIRICLQSNLTCQARLACFAAFDHGLAISPVACKTHSSLSTVEGPYLVRTWHISYTKKGACVKRG